MEFDFHFVGVAGCRLMPANTLLSMFCKEQFQRVHYLVLNFFV